VAVVVVVVVSEKLVLELRGRGPDHVLLVLAQAPRAQDCALRLDLAFVEHLDVAQQ